MVRCLSSINGRYDKYGNQRSTEYTEENLYVPYLQKNPQLIIKGICQKKNSLHRLVHV